MKDLASKKCLPCKEGATPLKGAPLKEINKELGGGWTVVKGHHLEKEFKFKDFKQALAFTNHVGKIAETQEHHPDIFLTWGKVKITVWTHKIDGLTESDFVLAAKIEQIPPEK